MIRTAAIPFSALELAQLAHALTAVSNTERGFLHFGLAADGAFTSALLKVARGRVALGEVKGIDLDLPPWAVTSILDALAPAAGVTLSPLPKAKAPRPRRAKPGRPRRARRRPRPLPGAGSVADVARAIDDDAADPEGFV